MTDEEAEAAALAESQLKIKELTDIGMALGARLALRRSCRLAGRQGSTPRTRCQVCGRRGDGDEEVSS